MNFCWLADFVFWVLCFGEFKIGFVFLCFFDQLLCIKKIWVSIKKSIYIIGLFQKKSKNPLNPPVFFFFWNSPLHCVHICDTPLPGNYKVKNQDPWKFHMNFFVNTPGNSTSFLIDPPWNSTFSFFKSPGNSMSWPPPPLPPPSPPPPYLVFFWNRPFSVCEFCLLPYNLSLLNIQIAQLSFMWTCEIWEGQSQMFIKKEHHQDISWKLWELASLFLSS